MPRRIEWIAAIGRRLALSNALTAMALADRAGMLPGQARRWIQRWKGGELIEKCGQEETTSTGPNISVWGAIGEWADE